MALPNYVCFQNLHLGRPPQTVVGRLLRSWDSRNFRRDGELMGVTVIFVDEKSTLINGFIPASIVDQFRSSLIEGHIYTLTVFEVSRCMQHYKLTEHPYIIRFLPATTLTVNNGFSREIVKQKFFLRSLEHLQSSACTNDELPDVVGLIRCVQGSNLEDVTSTQRLVVRLQISLTETVSLTLWDEAAATFRAHVASQKTKQSVMIITTVNPKYFGGGLFLNSTSGTRFYFDKELDAVKEFGKILAAENETSFSCVETSATIKKREVLTIKELHTYICNANEQTQEANFICEAIVKEILLKNGWSYVSCAACSRKLEKYGQELRCNRCVSPNVTGVVRYRVELNVEDDGDSATFVVFDSPMASLLSKTAETLILECGGNGDVAELPICFAGLVGKKFRFNVKVTPFNFTSKHRTFTVSSVTSVGTPKHDTSNDLERDVTKGISIDGDAKKETRKRRRS